MSNRCLWLRPGASLSAVAAFFTVIKNRRRPFVVCSNELVTRLLGTSFVVKALEDAQQMEVCSKTGKVPVFPRTDTEVFEGKITPDVRGGKFLKNVNEYFPIPQSQIDISTRNGESPLKQNPGYQ